MLPSIDKKKKLQIQGFKFFQYALKGLRNHVKDPQLYGYDKPLTASATAMYIGFVSECKNASGLLDSDITVASVAQKVGLASSTANDGYHQLLERGLLRFENGTNQLEIVGYGEHNKSREESYKKNAGLNYFFVPFELFNTTILAQLVRATSARGIILLLEQCNEFSREFKNKKINSNSVTDELKMSTLKEKLDLPSAARVRRILDILSPLFSFKPESAELRKPRDISTRIRKAVTQIWVRKYIIYINPNCVIEKQEIDTDAIKAIKDADFRIKYLNLPLPQRERTGIRTAYRSIVQEIAQFITDGSVRKKLLTNSMQIALDNLESFIKERPGELKSVGKFLNSQLQKYVLKFLDIQKETKVEILVDLQTELLRTYEATGAQPPFIWRKYEEHRNASPNF